MYGIYPQVYERLLNYFRNTPQIKKVTLFGSRAKALDSYSSDIDLCIDITGNMRGHVILDIQDLLGVYSCDILFEDKVEGEIKNQIEKDGIVIYMQP